ncbi:MAG: 23S rRNA (uracil(1939)-C(5))-methyltransferase RlmD [Ruminococcaceae bacterium]|nr:23S rRNA (uracil(1939)-C(5))-methyltransferase RlmD [Oscillospiraceae bacterium]
MEIGQNIKLTITDVATGGSGVGRYDGMAVFVPQTCRGELVEAKITRIKSGCAYATLRSVLEPAPHRRDGFCEQAGLCGGCDFAHISYEEQLAIKQKIVRDALERIGGFSDVKVEETLPAPKTERYRNKMVFPLDSDKKGRAIGGFYAPGSHQLVPLSDCKQGDRAASLWLREIISFLNETNLSVYNEHTHRGFARRVFVRLAEGTKEAMVVLTATKSKLPDAEKLVERLLAVPCGYELKSIILNIHKEPNNLLLGKKNIVLYGRNYIVDTLGNLRFHISPHSFYQINPLQTKNLYETALSLANLTGKETVLDLYCGIGTISLFAAGSCARVIGVEVVPQAIEDANENAKRNGITNAEFIVGKAEEVAPQLAARADKPSVIILDPPRKGAEPEALAAILEMNPEKIVYVSCNPATLARDAKILADGGYTLQKAIPADMFPNTSHVECVVLLSQTEYSQ